MHADTEWNKHYVLDEGEDRVEEHDAALLELPRTLRVAFAATASTNNSNERDIHFANDKLQIIASKLIY